jgi:hypothetical protein
MQSNRSSRNWSIRIWISSRARRRARREKSVSGETGVAAEGCGVGCATGAEGAAPGFEASIIHRRAKSFIVTSIAQFTAKARGSKDEGPNHRG